jgi:hypothetical protein
VIALRAGIAALTHGGRLWNLTCLPAIMEDLPLRLESRSFERTAFPQVSHNRLGLRFAPPTATWKTSNVFHSYTQPRR